MVFSSAQVHAHRGIFLRQIEIEAEPSIRIMDPSDPLGATITIFLRQPYTVEAVTRACSAFNAILAECAAKPQGGADV